MKIRIVFQPYINRKRKSELRFVGVYDEAGDEIAETDPRLMTWLADGEVEALELDVEPCRS